MTPLVKLSIIPGHGPPEYSGPPGMRQHDVGMMRRERYSRLMERWSVASLIHNPLLTTLVWMSSLQVSSSSSSSQLMTLKPTHRLSKRKMASPDTTLLCFKVACRFFGQAGRYQMVPTIAMTASRERLKSIKSLMHFQTRCD